MLQFFYFDTHNIIQLELKTYWPECKTTDYIKHHRSESNMTNRDKICQFKEEEFTFQARNIKFGAMLWRYESSQNTNRQFSDQCFQNYAC